MYNAGKISHAKRKIPSSDLHWKFCFSCLTVLFFLGILRINLEAFAFYCDGDMYLDTAVSKLMWEQKRFLPEGWVFSNQIYITATPNLCALLYGFFGDLNLAMGVASTLMCVLTLSAFTWMLWPFLEKKRHVLVGIIALMGGIVSEYITQNLFAQVFFILCSYYSCYLLTACLVWGQYIRLALKRSYKNVTGDFVNVSRPPLRGCYDGIMWVLCFMLSLAMGLQSVRQTIVMLLPLGVMEVLLLVLERKSPVYCSRSWFALGNAIANLMGLIWFYLLDVPHQTLYGEFRLLLSPASIRENWKAVKFVIRDVWGYVNGGDPWMRLYSLCFVAAVVYAVFHIFYVWLEGGSDEPMGNMDGEANEKGINNICGITVQKKLQQKGFVICIFLFLVSLLGVIVGKCVTPIYLRPIYLFMWFPFAAVCLVYCFDRGWKSGRLYSILSVVFFCLMLMGYQITYGGINDEREAQLRLQEAEAAEMAEWLASEGYNLVYSRWGCQFLAVASNGQLFGAFWSSNDYDDMFGVTAHLTRTDIFSEESNENAIYLIENGAEVVFLEKAKSLGAEVSVIGKLPLHGCSVYVSDRQLIYEK